MAAEDPAASSRRAMAAISEAGLAAASSIVEQVLSMAQRAPAGFRLPFPTLAPMDTDEVLAEARDPRGPLGALGDPRDARRLRADAERLIELYGEWTRLLLDAAVGLAEQAATPPAGGAADLVRLGPVPPGAVAHATAWLHLLDGPPMGFASLFATALTGADGSTIDPGCVVIEPVNVDTIEMRSSVELHIDVSVPDDAAAGVYRGHLLAKGLEEVALGIEVWVGPA